MTPSPLAKADFEDIAGAAIASGQTLPQMLIAACKRHGDKPAFTNLDHSLSFSDLDRLGADLAAYLRGGLGLVAGDRVAIMVPNLLQFPVALLGVLRADLIAVLVNPMYTARELHHQLADSGARVLIVVDNFGHVAAEAVPGSDVTHGHHHAGGRHAALAEVAGRGLHDQAEEADQAVPDPGRGALEEGDRRGRAASARRGEGRRSRKPCSCSTPAAPPAYPRAPSCHIPR